MTRTPVPASLLTFARDAGPALKKILEAKTAEAAAQPLALTPAFERASEYVLRGGKRLRGALCLLGCQAGGGTQAQAFPAALGLELFHAYLLVHDDFMDRDAERRGGPTLHLAFTKPDALAPGARTANEHTANSLAVLFGSLMQSWALEQIFAATVAPERIVAAAQLMARALGEVTLGQAMDVTAPLIANLPHAAALRIEELKTGSYTFELPLTLGALLAGASPETHAALTAYARPLGQAFQIADDLLGVFGSPEQTGKSAGNDLREGKRTLIVLRALETASEKQRIALLSGLGNPNLGDAEIEDLREVLRRSGAAAYARGEAEKLCAQAEKALAAESIPAAVGAELRAIARYTVQRES